jgi:hypothetical protein
MAFPDSPGNQVTILRAEIDNGYRFSWPGRYSLYLGCKLLTLKLSSDFKVSRDFNIITGSYTMAFSFFIHLLAW